jgi:hypothetical protein
VEKSDRERYCHPCWELKYFVEGKPGLAGKVLWGIVVKRVVALYDAGRGSVAGRVLGWFCAMAVVFATVVVMLVLA